MTLPLLKSPRTLKQLIQDNAEEAAYSPVKVLNDAFASIGTALAIAYYQEMLRALDRC